MKEKKVITIKEVNIKVYKIEVKNPEIPKGLGYDVELHSHLKAQEFVEHYCNTIDKDKPYAHVGGDRDTTCGWQVYFKDHKESTKTVIVEYINIPFKH